MFRQVLGLTVGALLLIPGLRAQTIEGRITDRQSGVPLSYANIGLLGSAQGTTANEEGLYRLKLPEPGRYRLRLQYLGYESRTVAVEVQAGEKRTLNVALAPESVQLQEVTVEADGAENPAYAMIRRAIARKTQNRNPVSAYQCQTYVKGVQRLANVPDRILGQEVSIEGFEEGQDSGMVYLSESLSRLYFRQGAYREVMTASKVSGDPRGYSWNSSLYFQFSFYDNLALQEIAERGLVSPLADNAFLFYDYRLLGSLQQDGRTVYKIEVLPKRDQDPVWKGHLYLVDSLWALQGAELALNNPDRLDFIDSGSVRQRYQPVGPGGVYLRQKVSFQLHISFLGVSFRAYYLGRFFDYELDPFGPDAMTRYLAADSTRRADSVAAAQSARVRPSAERRKAPPASEETPRRAAERFATKTLVEIQPEANRRDSQFWAQVRPAPLTQAERRDYRRKDSIRVAHQQPAYLDSLRRADNIFGWSDLMTGYRYRRPDSLIIGYRSVLTTLGFNPVEGGHLSLRPYLRREYNDYHAWQVEPELRYGGASETFFANLRGRYQWRQFAKASLAGGRAIRQFGETQIGMDLDDAHPLPVASLINTMNALFNHTNFMRLYGEYFVAAAYQDRLARGLDARFQVAWRDRSPLRNNSNWSFSGDEERRYDPNQPQNAVQRRAPNIGASQLVAPQLTLNYRFGEHYIERPDTRVIFVPTDHQTRLQGRLKGGLGRQGGEADFVGWQLALQHDRPLGLLGDSRWTFRGGDFPQAPTFFQDYHHFRGNRFLVLLDDINRLGVLPYYQRSTNQSWLQARWRHDFGGFIFNKIPWLRKRGWQAVAVTDYLYTPQWSAEPHYVEAGLGIQGILKVLQVHYVEALVGPVPQRRRLLFGIGF